MATQTQVKHYLAYWFQLGKQVVSNHGHHVYFPQTVIQGDRFSQEFEQCWRDILQTDIGSLHLEGTHQTIQDLLSSAWEMTACARCSMLIPIQEVVLENIICPCHDILDWPNQELPQPRLPVNNEKHLSRVKDRLMARFPDEEIEPSKVIAKS